jgi:hypothetical protein
MLFYDKIDVGAGKIVDANHKMFQTTKIAAEAALWFSTTIPLLVNTNTIMT